MKSQLQLGPLLLLILAGWISRRQQDAGEVRCRERLGGMLSHNHRKAA